MRILFATSNPYKIREVREILEPQGIEIEGLDSLSELPDEPEEDGATFEDNARIKAVAYAQATGQRCLAEDSGLCVDALGGRPGVHSARFAGVEGTRDERDRANNDKLLRELQGVPEAERTARFVCAMCVVTARGEILAEVQGRYEGRIAFQPVGENGFGYDPLLFVPDAGCTSAQLSSDQKHARSHRGQAARQLAVRLRELENT